jgi:hypothetical protein
VALAMEGRLDHFRNNDFKFNLILKSMFISIFKSQLKIYSILKFK